jgi:hypothetical protein
MDIRKISVGPDYKSGAMHYLVGQDILNSSHKIHLKREDEILLWKEFNLNMPISIEYNINF